MRLSGTTVSNSRAPSTYLSVPSFPLYLLICQFAIVIKPTIQKEVESLSRVRLFATPWTVAYKAPLSMEFSRQEYWSGLPFPSPEDLPNPGIEPGSPALQADALPSEPLGKPCEVYISVIDFFKK